MLKKMIIQGLIAAAIIGGASVVYAQALSNTGHPLLQHDERDE